MGANVDFLVPVKPGNEGLGLPEFAVEVSMKAEKNVGKKDFRKSKGFPLKGE